MAKKKVSTTIHTSGSRKNAIARATLKKGTGILLYNSFSLDTITNPLIKEKLKEPLHLAGDKVKEVNISVKTQGGGIIGQAEAARVAIAKALAEHDKSLSTTFMEYDRTLLINDVRRKETHKPNRHGKARGRVQKSYR